MEERSIYSYFFFGTAVRYLQDVKSGYPIFGDYYVIANINSCLDRLDELGLRVTKIAASELREFTKELAKTKDKTAKLSDEQATELSKICSDLRRTLDAELSTLDAFIVTPKRFDIDKLLNDIGALMSKHTFSSLSEPLRYDFIEAGKCIAFGRATAGAFHLLRGTEAVLRHFYCTLIRTKRVCPLLWGPMVQDLRKRAKTKRYTALYNNLDNIREYYRNPTQHPEVNYDIDSVQDLLPLCFEVIGKMTKIIS